MHTYGIAIDADLFEQIDDTDFYDESLDTMDAIENDILMPVSRQFSREVYYVEDAC